ncbi:translocation/assembly module TamB domain-containing protein [Legionella cardiaca]|uniref:Translocation/assembly module TamB domain-containing protein n=1 Tax=Legionella cardiaca TaxID=1071983 RepID=A0ABY8ASQ8_9GAMM|nr:translocation/assembly module TamB domain-containing protein [Legionella cardiaca]WED43715.1 translocation/assembly module TamB domain-containing protein [Legionella cardiaca]
MYKLALVFAVLTAVVIFLATTSPGLSLTLKLASYLLPGTLYVEKVHGRLISQCSLDYLSYHDETMNVVLKELHLKWQPMAFLRHKLTIENLTIKQAQLKKTGGKPEENMRKTDFAVPKLPFDVTLENVLINQMQFIQDNTTHQFQNVKLQMQLTNHQWQINQLNFDFDKINFSAKFTGQPVMPYGLSAELKLKSKQESPSQIEGTLQLSGDFFLYHWQGDFKQPTQLHLNGVLKNGRELHAQTQWQNLLWPLDNQTTFQSPVGHITMEGQLPNIVIKFDSQISSPLSSSVTVTAHTQTQGIRTEGHVKLPEANLNFNIDYNEAALNAKIKGMLHAESIPVEGSTLAIKDLKADAQFTGESLLNLSLNTQVSANYFAAPLLANIHYQHQRLEGSIRLGMNEFNIRGTSPYQWQATATLPKPQMLHPALTGLNTTITANASLSNVMMGTLDLTIKPGYYQLEEEGLSRLEFQGGQLKASLTPQNLILNGLINIDKDKSLTAQFKLPQFKLNDLSTNQALQGNLRLDVNTLNFLQSFSPELAKPEGQLSAILKATGTVTKPMIEGNIILKNGRASIPNLGLDFQAIQFEVKSRNKHWQAHGSLTSNEKILTLKGQGSFAPQVTGLVHLNGNDFTLLNTPEYLINISPKLLIEFTSAALAVKGTIIIPKAQIKPQSFSNSVSLSEDVVFEGNERPVNPLHIKTDIRLEMGDDVSLNVKGLKGFLTGAIHLHQLPQEPLNATGELNVKEGKYQAYGQDLAIAQGQLIFTGGSVLNPGIRVRAVRQFKNTTNSFAGSNQLLDFNNANLQSLNFGNKTTVGIDVTGRLTSPKVELFSIPSTLSQADILSMILLGRPANQANKAGGQLLLAAISSMNLGTGANGTQLVEQLKQTLGVDVNLENTPKFDQKTNQITDKTSVVVGKSLSKRLYVSYNYGLAKTDSNVVTLSYLLNKFFSVQVNSSLAGSGIDLLYTHRKD